MKQLKTLAAVAVLLVAVPTTTLQASNTDVDLPKPVEKMTAVDWQAYSGHLVAALNSDHIGLKESALRYAILYKDSVSLNGATISMMKILNNCKN